MGLREKGTREAVDAVSQIVEKLGDKWMRYSLSVARSALLRESWKGIPPRILIRMAGDRELRVVDSEVTLVDLVMASLNTYQGLLLGELSPIRLLWNTERDRIRPKGEEEIANAIALHLRKNLADRRIIVNRNVDIRMVDEVDILVEAITDDKLVPLRIIIEVKGCWHPHVKTAMEHQLRDRYLRHNECSQGIYLVVWTYCEQWDNNDYRRDDVRKNFQTTTIEEAREYFENQAKILSLPMAQLRSFILDARYL